MTEIRIDDDLCACARKAAEREGYASLEAFVTAAIAERVQRPKRRSFLEAAHRLRERLAAEGLSEEEILAEFERSRELPPHAPKLP